MTPIFVLAALLAFSPHRRPMIRPVDGRSPIDASFDSRRERRRWRGGISTTSALSGGASSVRGCHDVATVIAGTTRLRRGSWGDRGCSVDSVGNVGGSGNGNGNGNGPRDYYHHDHDDHDDDDDDEAYYQDGTGTNNKSNRHRHRHRQQQQRQQYLKSPYYSPPNIKLMPQPRKKELWLPWPLGAMRSDYYRFAETEVQRRRKLRQRRRGGGGIGGGASSSHPPSEGGGGAALLLVDAREEWRRRLERARGWATDALQRGAGGPMMVQRFQAVGTADGGNVLGGGGGDGIPRNDGEFLLGGEMGPSSSSSSPSSRPGSKSAHHGAWDAAIASSIASSASWLPWTKGDGNVGGKIARDGAGGAAGGAIVATDERRSTIVRGGESANGSADGSPDGGNGGGGSGLDRDVLLRYLRLQASVRMRQLGYVGSDFSVHLPPASPVLLFYYALPSRQDPMRRLVRYAVAGATLSWMHAECTKYRRFSPLPGMRGVNVRRPDLPPFLPPEEDGWGPGPGSIGDGDGGGTMEKKADPAKTMAASSKNDEAGDDATRRRGGRKGGSGDATAVITPRKVPPSYGEAKANKSTTTKEAGNDDVGGGGGGGGGEGGGEDGVDDNGHHHPMWDPFQSFGSVSSIYRTWLEGNNVRAMRSAEQRRAQASDQLLALRKIMTASSSSVVSTNNFTSSVSSSSSSSFASPPPPPTGGGNNAAADNSGYALVTGASSGIGRALRYASLRGP